MTGKKVVQAASMAQHGCFVRERVKVDELFIYDEEAAHEDMAGPLPRNRSHGNGGELSRQLIQRTWLCY